MTEVRSAEFNIATGDEVVRVNPRQVRYVQEYNATVTEIVFSENHKIAVRGDIDSVSDELFSSSQ